MNHHTHIYLNGERRQIVGGFGPTLYLDHPSLPGRRCSCHNIGMEAANAIMNGMAVKTLGNVYSFRPGVPAAFQE